jgi:hypothetical protein
VVVADLRGQAFNLVGFKMVDRDCDTRAAKLRDLPTASVCQLVEAADGRQGDAGASGRMYALR